MTSLSKFWACSPFWFCNPIYSRSPNVWHWTVQADVVLVPQIGAAERFKVDMVSTKCHNRNQSTFKVIGHLFVLESNLLQHSLSVGWSWAILWVLVSSNSCQTLRFWFDFGRFLAMQTILGWYFAFGYKPNSSWLAKFRSGPVFKIWFGKKKNRDISLEWWKCFYPTRKAYI